MARNHLQLIYVGSFCDDSSVEFGIDHVPNVLGDSAGGVLPFDDTLGVGLGGLLF